MAFFAGAGLRSARRAAGVAVVAGGGVAFVASQRQTVQKDGAFSNIVQLISPQPASCEPGWVSLTVFSLVGGFMGAWMVAPVPKLAEVNKNYDETMSPQENEAMVLINKGQMKQFVELFNDVTMQCFSDCATDFSKRTLTKEEGVCSDKCITKFMKANQRLQKRFIEQQEENGMQGGKIR